MPSPCCRGKYSKPNKCRCPSNNCDCFVQPLQCPPTSEDEEAPVLYAPIITAAPLSKKCCCLKCCCTKCEIKQKKSLWQQLFGDRKCCPPCQKKKQECLCKQKKKPRCVCECSNQICCNSYKQPPPPPLPPPPPPKPCKPLCCCKLKPYKRKTISKPCCPATPESLFGCHFYCNVEDRSNRSKRPRCQCCCSCMCSREPNETTDDEKATNNYKYTNNKGGLSQAPPPPKSLSGSKKNEDSLKQPIRQNVEPTQSNIHIGLTITNTDTKYYKKNTSICPSVEEDPCYNSNENEVSSGSSERIITLEIHQSDEKVDQDKKEIQSKDEENASISSSRRRALSTVREENESHIKSESYTREIKPLLERKRNSKDSSEENRNSFSSSGKRENRTGSKRREVDRLTDIDLDKRVSEILRRLQTIESKINMIDRNKPENKNFKFDIDKNKSTVSFHLKDGKFYEGYDNNDYRTTRGKSSRKADAVIEIRQTRSKSCSPVRKYSSTQISRKHRYSRSLDRSVRAQRENPKLIIKVPHGNKISQGTVTVYDNKRIKSSSRDYRDTEWTDISNELKSRNPAHSRCYCYECVCQRARCK